MKTYLLNYQKDSKVKLAVLIQPDKPSMTLIEAIERLLTELYGEECKLNPKGFHEFDPDFINYDVGTCVLFSRNGQINAVYILFVPFSIM